MNLAGLILALLLAPAWAQKVEPIAIVLPINAGLGATALAGALVLPSQASLRLPASPVAMKTAETPVSPVARSGAQLGGLRAMPVASRDWGAYFDQSRARPTGASDVPAAAPVFEQVFGENPAVAQAIEGRLRAAGLAAALPGPAWRERLPGLFEPFFAMHGAPQTVDQRKDFARYLLQNTSHRAEDWTYLFRDHPLWKELLERYLDGLIASRKDSRRLELDSVGAGYGSEAYSLAITVQRALERAGEDPGAWDVRIRTQDVSLASLLAADGSLYRPSERDKDTFAELELGQYFEPAEGGLLRLRRPMREWIRPYFVDLNDERQHALLPERSDVVFANYLLFHLRRNPATALAERWLAGNWSEHGFLSMAQVLVAEVGASRRAKALDIPIKYLFSANVGWAGAAFYGENFRPPGGVKDAFREMWRRRGVVKAVEARGASIESALSKDPFAKLEVDPAALAALRRVSAESGLAPSLTTEEVSVRADAQTGTLYVNAGWLLTGPGSAERLRAFGRLVREELARLPSSGARAPPAGAITGRLFGGGVLKVAETQTPYLYWLTDRLTPITAAYRSDNAAKSEEKLQKDEQKPSRFNSSGIPNGVRGLN